jgi:acyl-CoA thioester hydrolase
MLENTTTANKIFDNAMNFSNKNNEFPPYIHQATYYETDQMGVIHHSNYIRWFEEARVDFLEKMGLAYNKIESLGILIPVLSVSCEYKSSVRFNDKVMIIPTIVSFNGVKMTIHYEILDVETKLLKAEGSSSHCFLNKEFKPIPLKRSYPDIYQILNSCLA